MIYVPDDGWYEVKAGHGNDLVCGYPDVTYGGTGADTMESTFGQDVTTFTAYGEEGDDTLIAHPTATPNEYHLENVLAGGPGDDVLTGGDQNDQISGGAGNDTIAAGAGNDAVADDGEAVYTVDAPTNADGSDHVDAGPGQDFVLVSAGSKESGSPDVIDGGPGLDTISYERSRAGAVVDLATQKAVGTGGATDTFQSFEGPFHGSSHADTILGTSGADQIVDYGGDNIIRTYGGDDQLDVAAGTVYAGAGDDLAGPDTAYGVVVHLGAGDDQAVGDMGFGTYLGGAGDDRFWQHQLTDGDTSKLTYGGGPGHDVLAMNYRLLSDFVRPVTVRSTAT